MSETQIHEPGFPFSISLVSLQGYREAWRRQGLPSCAVIVPSHPFLPKGPVLRRAADGSEAVPYSPIYLVGTRPLAISHCRMATATIRSPTHHSRRASVPTCLVTMAIVIMETLPVSALGAGLLRIAAPKTQQRAFSAWRSQSPLTTQADMPRHVFKLIICRRNHDP